MEMSQEDAEKNSKAITTPAGSTVDPDENKAPSSVDETELVSFPPPKYVVTIVSPRVIQLHESDASLDEWKEFEENEDDERTATLLNLHVLLVSLLNRLLKARLFPRRAVHSYITPAAGTDDHEWVVFSILTPATVLPILLSKCEHFGVGNLVGLVYAVPMETCVLPLLNQTVEEEEAEGLLTVPSQLDATPISTTRPSSSDNLVANGVTSVASSTAGGAASMPDSSSVLVMAPSHKKTKTPDPVALRPVISETFDKSASELVAMAPPPLQRSSSHPDVIQTSTLGNEKKEKGATNEKHRETSLLEIIPEAKGAAVPKDKDKDKDSSGKSGDTNKPERPVANKSALIEKVLDARKEWLATASRIRVEQVAEEVTAAASLTWDYLLFVVCAAAIAATGLATDSSVTVLGTFTYCKERYKFRGILLFFSFHAWLIMYKFAHDIFCFASLLWGGVFHD